MEYQLRQIELPEGLQRVVLHTCCAPCSSAIIKTLLFNGVEVVVYFYNPNIHPLEEYERRKAEIIRFAHDNNVAFVDGDYAIEAWNRAVEGYENEPERGQRCQKCFALRLIQTAAFAQSIGITHFATTLASSRWKSLEQIERAGLLAQESYPNTRFWHRNWRKDGLQELRQQIIKAENFYNQTYCGCVYSHPKESQ